MPKTLLAAGLSACLAVGVIALFIAMPATPPTLTAGETRAAPSERLLALESALDEERRARQLLEEELFRLIEEVERLKGGESPIEIEESPERAAALAQAVDVRNRFNVRGGVDAESRAAELVAGGFSPDRAATIARREAELRMQAMQSRFEARQAGELLNFFETQFEADQTLRDELGEAEYERYLEASNRSTSVGINDVLEFSPAEQAGLRRGDRIVRYNGERVYNLRDLNRQQMQEDVGANVVVDIVRDGVPMQVTVPRGPLGVMAGRGR